MQDTPSLWQAPRRAPRRPRSPARAQVRLSKTETGIIAYFCSWGEVLGVPSSVAQIYGLLYAAPEPLSPEDIRLRLGASKGSVSQGLRFLRERGLLRVVKAGRMDRFEACATPGLFARSRLRDLVAPKLKEDAGRLAALRDKLGDDPVMSARVARLESWNRRGLELLPLLLNLLDG